MGIVDFHTHVLPGIDDGSQSIAESMALLRAAARQGITHMVATPHFYPNQDTPERFFLRRDKAEAKLRQAMATEPGLPELHIGAEVYFFPGLSNSEVLREMAIRGTKAVLVEMPMQEWTDKMFHELESIRHKTGLTPIVAHVDRYIAPLRTYRIPERLAELPVLVQANASFFQRLSTKGMALKMLQRDQIQLLGSDCHNLKDRPENLGTTIELIERKLGPRAIQRINSYESMVLPL